MGQFLTVPHTLLYEINQRLSANALRVYLLMLQDVVFQARSRRPASGTEFFEYSFSKAKRKGYAQSKQQFHRGIQELIWNEYLEQIVDGHFQGKTGEKKQNIYRMLRY